MEAVHNRTSLSKKNIVPAVSTELLLEDAGNEFPWFNEHGGYQSIWAVFDTKVASLKRSFLYVIIHYI